jgi:hypothetical protein
MSAASKACQCRQHEGVLLLDNRQHTSAHVSIRIRQHTSAYVSIRILLDNPCCVRLCVCSHVCVCVYIHICTPDVAPKFINPHILAVTSRQTLFSVKHEWWFPLNRKKKTHHWFFHNTYFFWKCRRKKQGHDLSAGVRVWVRIHILRLHALVA